MMFNENLIIDIVLDFIYPPRCAACDKILEKSEIKSGFCKACRSIISFTTEECCVLCGRTLVDKSKEFCSDCEKNGHEFIQAKAIYEYSGPMKESMYRFKYENRRTYGKVFAKDACESFGKWINHVNPKLIVPVPMYPKKERLRGYNQAGVFAGYLSAMTGIPCVEDVITRNKDTNPLKTLSPEERKRNLSNAFVHNRMFKRGVDILVVDDIFTTGATIDQVAMALKEARAGNVYGLFICTGKAENKRG